MTIQEVKREAYYYGGKRISNEEAKEILDFIEDYPDRDPGEIIQEFLNLE